MTVQEITEMFRQLELELVQSLKRNLKRHMTQEDVEGGQNGVPAKWEAWQSATMRDMERFRKENQAIIQNMSPVIDQELQNIIMEQYKEGGADDFFAVNDRRVHALINEMGTIEPRVEKAALRYMDDVYRKTVRKSALGMATGTMTMQQATDAATKDFLAQGINCIQYKDGRLVNIASYAEMAVRTAGIRAYLMGEAAKRAELGIDTVRVSQYGACSKTCLPWQGKVYIDDVFGAWDGERHGDMGKSKDGKWYLLLSVAIDGGLLHPNCRHTLSTWIDGVSKPSKPMDAKKIQEASKLEEKQRALERRVRRAKREAAGCLDLENLKEAKRKQRMAQKQLKQFVDAHSDILRRDYWRERDALKQ